MTRAHDDRERSGRRTRDHEDRGATLILAIAVVLVVGAISSGLTALVTSSLGNRSSLEAARDREYAADGAIEYAIAQVRLASDPARAKGNSPIPPLIACDQTGGSMAPNGRKGGMPVLNDIPIRVDWSNACGSVRGGDGAVVVQRNVIFSACLDGDSPCTEQAMIVRAQVNFQQRLDGGVTATYVQSWSVIK